MTNPTALEVFIGVGKIDLNTLQGRKIHKHKMSVIKSGATADDFPVLYGLAMGGLSTTEIAEALAADPQGINDADQMEETNRKVFPLGVFPRGPTDSQRKSLLRETHIPWKEFPEGVGLIFWAQNWESSVQTGDPVIDFTSVFTGEWMRD